MNIEPKVPAGATNAKSRRVVRIALLLGITLSVVLACVRLVNLPRMLDELRVDWPLREGSEVRARLVTLEAGEHRVHLDFRDASCPKCILRDLGWDSEVDERVAPTSLTLTVTVRTESYIVFQSELGDVVRAYKGGGVFGLELGSFYAPASGRYQVLARVSKASPAVGANAAQLVVRSMPRDIGTGLLVIPLFLVLAGVAQVLLLVRLSRRV